MNEFLQTTLGISVFIVAAPTALLQITRWINAHNQDTRNQEAHEQRIANNRA